MTELGEIIEKLRKINLSQEKANRNVWEERFEWLEAELLKQRENAEDLLQDYKEQGLTFNTIEAEGFLRGSITAHEWVKYIMDNTND